YADLLFYASMGSPPVIGTAGRFAPSSTGYSGLHSSGPTSLVGRAGPTAEHASPPALGGLRLHVAQTEVGLHLLAGIPLLFRRRRGELGARHRDQVLQGAEIPLERAPLVGIRRRHPPRPFVQVGHELVERLEIARHAELHDVPGPGGGLAELVDLLVRPPEAGVELTTETVMGGHRETPIHINSTTHRGPGADPAPPVTRWAPDPVVRMSAPPCIACPIARPLLPSPH